MLACKPCKTCSGIMSASRVPGLTEAVDILGSWQHTLPQPSDRQSHELANMIVTGRLIAEAALLREESRGAHFRSDFPQRSPEWLRHIVTTIDKAEQCNV